MSKWSNCSAFLCLKSMDGYCVWTRVKENHHSTLDRIPVNNHTHTDKMKQFLNQYCKWFVDFIFIISLWTLLFSVQWLTTGCTTSLIPDRDWHQNLVLCHTRSPVPCVLWEGRRPYINGKADDSNT